MKKKVIVAGHICLDITPVFSPKKTDALEKLLIPGKLINVEAADVHTGGAVANTGLAMKIFGADVSLMGKVGDDEFGSLVKTILARHQVEQGLIIDEETSTSYSVVLAVPGIDRIFLHSAGANDYFTAADIPQEALQEADLMHYGYPPLMKAMYREDGKELVKLFQKAKEAGTMTSLDLAMVDPSSEASQADWKAILGTVLPYVDFFAPSAEELCYMLDRERYEQWAERAQGKDVTEVLDIVTDIEPLARKCMEMGCKVLIIKCGAPGLYYQTAGVRKLDELSDFTWFPYEEWADKKGFEKSYVPDRILSGTGAGDVTIGAFLAAMLEGYSLTDCLHLAVAAGAFCIAEYDALSGLKTLPEMDKRIKAGWQKRGM